MARKNLRIIDLAAALEITRATLGKKLARKYPLTLDEAFILLNLFSLGRDTPRCIPGKKVSLLLFNLSTKFNILCYTPPYD